MPHLANVPLGESFAPGAVGVSSRTCFAVDASRNGLAFEIPDQHEAFLADDLHPRVVPVLARADAGDGPQAAVLESNNHESVVVVVLGVDAVRGPFEVGDLDVDSLWVRTHQPPKAIPVVTVDLGQQAIGSA